MRGRMPSAQILQYVPTEDDRRSDYASGSGVVDAVGVGWQIIRDVIENKPDISVNGHRQMKGYKAPGDDTSYIRGPWKKGTAIVSHAWEAGYIDEISAKFDVTYSYNNHAVGNILIPRPKFNDAWLWSLDVEVNIRPDDAVFAASGNAAIALVEIFFDYEFYSSARRVHRRKTLQLYGNGYKKVRTKYL